RAPRQRPGVRALGARADTENAGEFGIDLDRTLVIGPSASTGRTAGTGAGAGFGFGFGFGGEPHTAAPVLGYLGAMDGVRSDDHDQFLFVSAGAGPSAACALYRPEGW
ncbi:hypothetical protein ACFXA3_16055, partial [Streptomyces sp. NPDC059456]|uniref:hypothetical protein n=1 Tax=Streptomyces sp. NPDC059456 TaxID=3346838 RepID=UPI00368CE307